MNFQEILEKLKTGADISESKEDLGVLNAWVPASGIHKAAAFMKEQLGFDIMPFVTALDRKENNNIEVVYEFVSSATNDRAVLRVKTDRSKPEVETVCDIYRTAEWHEREVFEMFGVNFLNHPDLRRLVLPDGIDRPLLKDFTHPDMKVLPK